jgi:hypothetical protein
VFDIKNITAAIRSRKSCRNFAFRRIDENTKNELSSLLSNIPHGVNGTRIPFEVIEKPLENANLMKLTYGLIRGQNTYVLGKIVPSKHALIDYGYLLEGIALRIQELGLGSCWVGYFDQKYFAEIKMDESEKIPSILVIGYPNEKFFLGSKIAEMAVGASHRKAWNKLFFKSDFVTPLEPDNTGMYQQALEMTRLAPSAGNKQPWRIVTELEEKRFHFYKNVISAKYESKGIHDIDMGICISHFDLMVKELGLNGKWIKSDSYPKPPKPETEYVLTWQT